MVEFIVGVLALLMAHNLLNLETLMSHIFRSSIASSDVGKKANNVTLIICVFIITSTIMWVYKMHFLFQTKTI